MLTDEYRTDGQVKIGGEFYRKSRGGVITMRGGASGARFRFPAVRSSQSESDLGQGRAVSIRRPCPNCRSRSHRQRARGRKKNNRKETEKNRGTSQPR